MADKALEFFAEMQQRGLVSAVATYEALISACVQGDKAGKALEVFAEMQLRGVEPTAFTMLALESMRRSVDFAE